MKTLRLILGDQLNSLHSWFQTTDPNVTYLIAELHQEANYARHHIQKIIGFFAAMEHFALQLREKGHQVIYLTLEDTYQYNDLIDLIQNQIEENDFECFQYQQPDEYRLLTQIRQAQFNVAVEEFDSEHFLLRFDDLSNYFKIDKHQTMEFFYRKMRKKFSILMDDDKPRGGSWNFDKDNRQKLTAKDLSKVPEPMLFENKVNPYLHRVEKYKIKTVGEIQKTLTWPITRQQSLELLSYFCQNCLPFFGRFQDAMTSNSRYSWSLFHSRLSFALNAKLITPLEVVERAVAHFEKNQGSITIAQIEGFVRQIIGWREFIRGIYWLNMPEYKSKNYLQATHPLPDFFWNGKTKMKCLSEAISQSLTHAYAHHIQRLMVTGNFCLVAGINPSHVDDWYLGIYVDAIEWVELPNTLGMSQFADGGIIATKPYAASGNYINKMSDYCSQCHYKVKEKTGQLSCPLNSLYWHFMTNHRSMLEQNPRTRMIFRSWDKQSPDAQQATLKRAEWVIKNLENL